MFWMKAILFVLVCAVLGLAVQNHRLSGKVAGMGQALRGGRPDSPAMERNTFSAEVQQLREAGEREAAHREDMDSLSNALSDRGIDWKPAN